MHDIENQEATLQDQSDQLNQTVGGDKKTVLLIILEERAAIRSLLMDWLARELKCGTEYIFEYEKLNHVSSRGCVALLSSRLLPFDKKIVPNKKKITPVVYGDSFSPTTVLWWQERGAQGLLDWQDGPGDWKAALERLLDGHAAETPSVIAALRKARSDVGLQALTRREMEVAQMLVKGASAKQVAKKLGTTEGTVKNQRKSVYRKLGIVRATQLPWAMGNGVPVID
jgi:DNA-binding CsgD family transcriptional regulator